MDVESEDSGFVNRGLDLEAVHIEGSRVRLGSSDDADRIEEAPPHHDNDNDSAANRDRQVLDERDTRLRDKKEERRQRMEEEKKKKRPVATQEELAALKAEPEKDPCTVPVCCNNIKVFCVFISAIFLLHGIVSKYTLEVLPNIGNRYPITQLEQEFVTGVEKIGFIITLIFVGFFGNRMNKVSAISSGSFLTAVGCVIMCTPYFIYGLNKSDSPSKISDYATAGLCRDFSNSSQAQCEFFTFDNNKTGPFSLFCVAQFIIGIGAALYATLGLVYIEDNAKSKQSPLMIGISLSSHSLGSFVGTLFAQWFISLPENASGEMTSTVKGEQVGAWWLGYPVFASIALLLGTCTLWFPDWFVVPVWLKRRRFKKRLLRYRKKKRVIASKKRKEQIKKLKKAKKAKKNSKRTKTSSNSDRKRSQNRQRASRSGDDQRRRGRPQSDNRSGRPSRNRSSRENENRDPPPYSQSNGNIASDAVPDLVAAHNGALTGDNAQRDSHHSDDSNPPDQTTADNTANTAEEEARRKEKERRRRRRKRRERRQKRYRRIVIRKEKLADLPRSLYKLVKNSVLLSSVFGSALAAFLLTGYTTELPTYLRIQFNTSPNSASIAASFAGPVAMAVGTLGGALYTYKWRPDLRKSSLIVLATLGLSTILLPIMFAFQCNLDPVIPIEVENLDITVDCSETCDCLNTQMELIHAPDGQKFLSPCHAGCKSIVSGSKESSFEYANCGCVPDGGKAFSGVGSTDCKLLIPTSLVVFVIVMLCSFGVVPAVTIFMRFARDKKRSLVVGYAFWMIYLFGYVPGTPIFRSLRNDRCSLWKEDCLQEEKCWTYNRDQYRYGMNGAAIVFHFIATLCFACNFYILHKKSRNSASDAENRQNRISGNDYDNPMMVTDSGEIQAAPANYEMRNETADNANGEIGADDNYEEVTPRL